MSHNIMRLCHDAAQQIFGKNPPSHLYANNVALLLAGTVATESLMKYRRQGGYTVTSAGGAWGLWQTESLPMIDNVAFLMNHKDVRTSCANFLNAGQGDFDAILRISALDLCRLCAGWDRFAVMMARIHYMRFPKPVPGNDVDRAYYYKKYYNTTAGKGSPEKYMADYHRLVSPLLKAGL